MTAEFDALYRSHYRRVFGLCVRMLGNPPQAEDATQEAFVRAYRAFDRYDSEQAFAPWVLSIASNHCIDLIRRRGREPGLLDDPDAGIESLPSTSPAVVDALVDAESSAALRAAIADLPDRYRLPLVMAYYQESSYDEIAAELGITRNHVGVLLLRARQSLRRALAPSEQEG